MKKYLFILAFFAFACGKTSKSKKPEDLPNSIGNVDDIVIVIDSAQWSKKSALGQELRKIFTSPVLGLPQDEPIFNVKVRKATELSSLLRNVSNLVFVNTLDCKTAECSKIRTYFSNQALNKIKKDSSLFMKVRKNVFAKDQTVMFLFSPTQNLLTKNIKENRAEILSVFEGSMRSKIKENLFSKVKKKLMAEIEKKHSFSMQIPFGYEKARDFDHFIWLRKINGEQEQSLFVHYEPYKDKKVFLDLGAYRDDITNRFLKDGEHPDVYIARQEIINVFTQKYNLNGHFAMQGRSLWKVSDGSRGGPYICYAVLDEKTNLVYYIEGYIDSPGTAKKDLMRELEAILASFKTKSDLEKS